jgi:hypothetical protein
MPDSDSREAPRNGTYVTRSEFNDLSRKVERMDTKLTAIAGSTEVTGATGVLGSMQNDISQMHDTVNAMPGTIATAIATAMAVYEPRLASMQKSIERMPAEFDKAIGAYGDKAQAGALRASVKWAFAIIGAVLIAFLIFVFKLHGGNS